MATQSQRLTASPLQLLRQALGGPRQVRDKAQRLGRTALLWCNQREVHSRLQALQRRGHIDQIPTRMQLAFGAIDMLRFVIVPASRDYYAAKGINFSFHQVLRVLDDPGAVLDPTGFFSDRDSIMGHVMQVVHLNPIYDLQLLEMFDDGLQRFEDDVAAMVAGTHPRAATIGAIIEDPLYHGRLLRYIQQYRADPASALPIVREEQSLRGDPSFAAAERQFATLPGYIAWCNGLPRDFAALVRHRWQMRAFPVAGQPPIANLPTGK